MEKIIDLMKRATKAGEGERQWNRGGTSGFQVQASKVTFAVGLRASELET